MMDRSEMPMRCRSTPSYWPNDPTNREGRHFHQFRFVVSLDVQRTKFVQKPKTADDLHTQVEVKPKASWKSTWDILDLVFLQLWIWCFWCCCRSLQISTAAIVYGALQGKEKKARLYGVHWRPEEWQNDKMTNDDVSAVIVLPQGEVGCKRKKWKEIQVHGSRGWWRGAETLRAQYGWSVEVDISQHRTLFQGYKRCLILTCDMNLGERQG